MSKSSKKNVPKKNSSVRPYTVMCTDLYLLWILLVYPLYYADGYFHLPERKATFWCTSTLVYIGVTLLGVIITYVSTRDEWSLERIKKNISMTDIFMFGFLISNLIAFALSEDKTNAWTGATGRYYGAKVLILVCISYFLISRYAWVNKVFIWAFLIAGNGVCLLATLDYFDFDVLGINSQMRRIDQVLFFSTIGNLNTCASFVVMAVGCAMSYYCVGKKIKDKAFSIFSIMNCVMAICTVRSDSAVLGTAIVVILLILFAFSGKIKLKNVIEVIILSCCTVISFSFIRTHFTERCVGRIAYYNLVDDGITRILWERTELFLSILICSIIVYSIFVYFEKKQVDVGKRICNRYIILCCVCLVSVVVVILLFKFNLVKVIRNGLGIDAESQIGTRVYMYEKAIEIFGQEPFINKIFGNGQALISQLYNQYYGEELAIAGLSINSCHDHVLDYLLTTGLLGAICYFGIVISSTITVLKKEDGNLLGIVVFISFIAYFIQGFFNIEQVVTTVVFWLFIALNEAAWKKEEMN